MLNALIFAAMAAGPAASAPYGDCVLANIHPGLTDSAVLLVGQACAARHPESFHAWMEFEQEARRYAVNAEIARMAEAAANAEAAGGKLQPAAAGSTAAAVAAAEAEAIEAAAAAAAMQPKVDGMATGADPAAGKNGR